MYKAATSSGLIVRNRVEAPSKQNLLRALKGNDLMPITIEQVAYSAKRKKTKKRNIKDVGISMIAQTLNLAPADKKLYALRDVTSCVESIPLIASSIMSKKIASGADKIVIDVTCGEGAFMKTKEDAKKLAKEMIEIGKLAGKETRCVITKMDEPLGYSVGNTLEVIEAINCLKANMPEDVKQVVLELGNQMMILSKMGTDEEKNKQRLLENIENGKAYNKFLELVKNQGGDIWKF